MPPRRPRPASHQTVKTTFTLNAASPRQMSPLRQPNVFRSVNPRRQLAPSRRASSPTAALFSRLPPRTSVALVAQNNTLVRVPYLGYSQGEMLTLVPLQRVVTPTGVQVGIPIGGTSTISAAIPLDVPSGFSVAIPTAYAGNSSHELKIKVPLNPAIKAPSGYTIVASAGSSLRGRMNLFAAIPPTAAAAEFPGANRATGVSKVGTAIRSRVRLPGASTSGILATFVPPSFPTRFKSPEPSPIWDSTETSAQRQLDSSNVSSTDPLRAEFSVDDLVKTSTEFSIASPVGMLSEPSTESPSETGIGTRLEFTAGTPLKPGVCRKPYPLSNGVQVFFDSESRPVVSRCGLINSPSADGVQGPIVDFPASDLGGVPLSGQTDPAPCGRINTPLRSAGEMTACSKIDPQVPQTENTDVSFDNSACSASSNSVICFSPLPNSEFPNSLKRDDDKNTEKDTADNEDHCSETLTEGRKMNAAIRKMENLLMKREYQETVKPRKTKAEQEEERKLSRIYDLVKETAGSTRLSDGAVRYLSRKGLAFAGSVIETSILYARFIRRKATDDDLRKILHRYHSLSINDFPNTEDSAASNNANDAPKHKRQKPPSEKIP